RRPVAPGRRSRSSGDRGRLGRDELWSVIARSDSDEAIQFLYQAILDCFASLAMTVRQFNLKSFCASLMFGCAADRVFRSADKPRDIGAMHQPDESRQQQK